jgi:hypothetical protein
MDMGRIRLILKFVVTLGGKTTDLREVADRLRD